MNNDLERRIKFLEKNKALLAWQDRVKRDWATEEEFDQAVYRLCRTRMRSLGLDPDGPLPLFAVPEDFGDPGRGILVGNPMHEDLEMPQLYLPVEDLTQCHVGAWGRTRYGKTYLLACVLRQVSEKDPQRTFICYDTQGELPGILANLLPREKQLWIPARDYWKNPLQDMLDHGLDKAIGIFKRALLESNYIGAPTVNILERLIRRRCTAEKLAAFGPPILEEFLQSAKSPDLGQIMGKSFSRNLFEYLHSLINVLGNILLNLGDIYNRPVSKGFTFRDLESRVVVIDLSGIKDPIAVKFLVVKELLELSLYAEMPHPPLTVVLDELHRFAPLEKRWGQFAGSILVDAVKTMLKFSVNFWFCEQNPGMMVNPAIFANTGTHFAFRMPSMKDRWPVLYAINVSERVQEEAVGTFEKQHCLVYSDSLGGAVLIKTPDLSIKDLREDARNRSQPVISAFHERFLERRPKGRDAAMKTKVQALGGRPTVQELTKKKIFEHRARFPLSGITETYLAAGVSPEIGRKHLQEMLDLGWLEGPERMPLPGSASKTKDCYVVTEKGCQVLSVDWKRARLPGKGALKSRLAAKMIGLSLERQGKVVRFEHCLDSGDMRKSSDAALLEEDGSITAYEYESSNSHLLENIRKNCRTGFIRTVVVCPNGRALAKAKKLVERHLERDIVDRVTFATLKEFAE